MPLVRPTLEEAIEAVRGDFAARLPGADTRTRRSPLDVFARVVGYVHHTIYGWLDWLAKQLLPDSSEVEWLARHASIWGVVRKPAAYATGSITITGTAGTLVPEATIWQRSDGVQYAQDAAATIGGGDSVAVVVTAVAAGDAGNADAGVPVSLVSPIAGVVSDAVVAEDGIAAGADEETDDSLRARVLARIQAPPHGGNAADYEQWALAVAGVTRAWVFPLANGAGTVVVRFMMDETYADGVPQPIDVAAVQEAIDAVRPVTALATVAAPVAVPLAFDVRITPDSAAIRAAIEAELRDLIFRDAAPGGTLLISHICEAISVAAGEVDHTLLAPTADQTVAAAQINTFAAITWA